MKRTTKLLDQVRSKLRLLHYAKRTEEAYVDWIRRFILFHDKRHPDQMGVAEVEAFLTSLAVEGNVAASTQNQTLSALQFLYGKVLEIELGPVDAVRARHWRACRSSCRSRRCEAYSKLCPKASTA